MYHKNEQDYHHKSFDESITHSHKLFSKEIQQKIKPHLKSYNMFYRYFNSLESKMNTTNPDYLSYDNNEMSFKD